VVGALPSRGRLHGRSLARNFSVGPGLWKNSIPPRLLQARPSGVETGRCDQPCNAPGSGKTCRTPSLGPRFPGLPEVRQTFPGTSSPGPIPETRAHSGFQNIPFAGLGKISHRAPKKPWKGPGREPRGTRRLCRAVAWRRGSGPLPEDRVVKGRVSAANKLAEPHEHRTRSEPRVG
jgi:hypothetical protein